MADRIVVGHVEGIVRSHDDVIGAVEAHQLGELMGREHDRVEIDFLEIAGRRLRQLAMRIRARAPGVIDAAGVGGQIEPPPCTARTFRLGCRSSTPSKIR